MNLGIRERIGWVLIRYNKAYGLLGSLLNAINFAGILTLVIGESIGVPKTILYPTLIISGILGITLFAVLIYDKLNFQTTMTHADGQTNDYWKGKLSPIQQKQTILLLEAIENKDKVNELKEKVKTAWI